MAKEKICGIYKIENLINGKVYVGSSINIKKRCRGHKKELIKNKHQNSYLQNAWNKYGELNFNFSIIEQFEFNTKEFLLEREQYWIDFLNACKRNYGYNLYPIAGSSLGAIRTDEQKERYRSLHKSKPILQIDINGLVIKRWAGIKEISKKTNYLYGSITDAVKKRRGYMAYGYIWVYEKEYLEGNFNLNYYLNNKHQTKKIMQFNLQGILIRTWDSLIEIIENNPDYKIASLSNVCNNYASHKSYKGYMWKYEFDYLENGILPYHKNKNKGSSKPIVQLDVNFNFIKLWESATQASKFYNISIPTILSCANGETQFSHGFRWIRKSDYDNGILTKYVQKPTKYKEIVQLSLDNDFIKIWKTANEIQKELKFSHVGILNCCKGKYKTMNKFKWMYKEDYDKLIS